MLMDRPLFRQTNDPERLRNSGTCPLIASDCDSPRCDRESSSCDYRSSTPSRDWGSLCTLTRSLVCEHVVVFFERSSDKWALVCGGHGNTRGLLASQVNTAFQHPILCARIDLVLLLRI
jgi:hypothetical protein